MAGIFERHFSPSVGYSWSALQTFDLIKITGGAPGAGKRLTSDADGDATWETPAAGGGTLDTAYDFGGAGAGRVITADNGAVDIQDAGGLLVGGNGGFGTITTIAGRLQVAETINTSPRGIMSSQHSDDTAGARVHQRKSRGSNASPTVIVTADNLARWIASGYDSANYIETAFIEAKAVGTIAPTRVPSQLSFWTSTDATPSVATQRMTITEDGRVGIGADPPVRFFSVESGVQASNDIASFLGSQGGFFMSGSQNISGVSGAVIAGRTAGGSGSATLILRGNTETIHLTSNVLLALGGGNVAIGTTTANRRLSVLDATGPQLRLIHTVSTHFADFQTGSAGKLTITPSGTAIVIPDAKNVELATTTGTQFGTASTQKIGFLGATPIVQRAHIADPTGGATVDAEARTAINAILVTLENFGFHAIS
jgi:hypothetical protein